MLTGQGDEYYIADLSGFAKAVLMRLEECTWLQSQSQLWFEQRVGQITASKFAAVAHASLDPLPTYLVKQLMERNRSLGVDHETTSMCSVLSQAFF